MKATVIVILLLLLPAVPVRAAEPLRWVALGAVAADVGSTISTLHTCASCRELNPMGAVGASLGAVAGWAAIQLVAPHHPKVARSFYVVEVGLHGVAAWKNIRLGIRMRVP